MHYNIWVFHHYADPPDGHWTGTYDLYKFLSRRGHDVTVYSSSFSHYTRTDERLGPREKSREEIFGGVRFVFVKTPPYQKNDYQRAWNMFLFGVRAYVQGSRRKPRPDIIVGSTPHPFCALSALQLAKKMHCRFFLELHDLWLEYLLDTAMISRKGLLARAVGAVDRRLYAGADRVLTLWPGMGDYLADCGVAREKIAWIPMGVDFEDGPVAAAKNGGCGGEAVLVMCAGRFGPASNVGEILEAVVLLKSCGRTDIRFAFLGDGPEGDRLRGYVRENGLTTVEFRGLVPKADIPRHLAEADILVAGLPAIPTYARYGTIPTKVIDYLAANRPIVYITDAPQDMVTRAGAGLIAPPGDAAALARTFVKLADMGAAARSAMGERGVAYLRENHDLARLASKLENLL